MEHMICLPPWRWFVKVKGSSRTPAVALTFDDGPNDHTTSSVLEILNEAGVRATFFVLGKCVEECPDILKSIAGQGHEIGIHGFDHSNGGFRRQVKRCRELIRIHAGVSPRLLRPHGGRICPVCLLWAKALGFRTVLWSVDVHDSMRHEGKWNREGPVYSRIQAGDILLMHDDNPICVTELPEVLATVRDKALKPITVSELLGFRGR